MKMRSKALFVLVLIEAALSRNDDRFNYRQTQISVDGANEYRDFGLQDWDKITCDDIDVCLGFPDDWKSAIDWELPQQSNCRWCPEGSDICGRHSMSPIRLERYRGDPSSEKFKLCEDGHWMKYEEGGCDWNDMVNNVESKFSNNFKIERHSLQILSPVDAEGNLKCPSGGVPRFPRVDYPKGFPRWWHLSHTEITTRSEHFQHEKQYDAEVHLSHFYEEDFDTREIGKIAIFLQAYEWATKWEYLDKLICQFRETEDEVLEACGLPSVPPYPGCRNPTRGQPSTIPMPTQSPPASSPTPAPTPDQTTTGQEGPPSSTWPPTARTLSPTLQPTMGDPIPTMAPSDPSRRPTVVPSPAPSLSPFVLDCPSYEEVDPILINFPRICKEGGCCDSERSATDHCHFVYDLFGESTSGMCQQCCPSPKEVGPPPPMHPVYPEPDCLAVEKPQRICRSCCGPQLSLESQYCVDVYQMYPFEIKSICWYCCGSTPKTVGYEVRRNLRAGTEPSIQLSENPLDEGNQLVSATPFKADIVSTSSRKDIVESDDTDPASTAWVRRLKLSEIDFEDDESFTVEDFTRMVQDFERRDNWEARNGTHTFHRKLQDINFESVPYHAYEWMLKVRTEYFFGYEGSQAVPPCFEKVHWRVMKDPIRVHKDQITELERLLSDRIAPRGSQFNECARDTAGKDRAGIYSNRTAVDVNRPLQQFHPFHRVEFCECQNWKSKFVGDKGWCQLDLHTRFYEHPYNFNSEWQF